MTAWLLLLLICTEPYPAECMRPTIDEITSNPVCVAVSKSCTLHQEIVRVPAWVSEREARERCVDRAIDLLAEERRNGYRRASRPECFEAQLR